METNLHSDLHCMETFITMILSYLIMAFLGAIVFVAPSYADDLSDCVDTPPAHAVSRTTVRTAMLKRVDLAGSPRLRAGACIDSPRADIVRARLGVLADNGQLLANFGQEIKPGVNAKQHGKTWSYFVNEDRITVGYDRDRIADRMLVQPDYADQTTGSLLQRVSSTDHPLKPIGSIAPGACLAPPHAQQPEIRDVSVLTQPADKVYSIDACVAAPANARMSAAFATVHVFARITPNDPHSPLRDVAQGGNGVIGLQPLAGTLPLHRIPHTIALISSQFGPKDPAMDVGPPASVVIAERQVRLCRAAKGGPCTPAAVDDLVGVSIIDRGTTPR